MDFYKRMEVVCQSIPYARIATYGQIALLCGKPRNSRQVGYALHHNLAGADIPAHRIVDHRGILKGAMAFATPDAQRNLLLEEGVQVTVFKDDQRVDLKKYGWKNTMNDAEEFRRIFEMKHI